jgi:hypothetical protein
MIGVDGVGGRLTDGKPSGTWITYDRNGKKIFESKQKEK